METNAEFTIRNTRAHCLGKWTASNLDKIEKKLFELDWQGHAIQFDLGHLDELDTPGAWLLHKTINDLKAKGTDVSISGADEQVKRLLALVAANSGAANNPPKPHIPGLLENVGRHTAAQLQQYENFLNFLGEMALVVWQATLHPWRIRGALLVKELEAAGLHALPIVGLLAFLLGIVIAYQGSIVLRDYGASIYVVDIVGLSVVRELAPLITAIIVAGRTGSAYTAQIGTMMVTEEVNALRSIGIAPLEMLVLPKLIALIIALPLLTVFADVMGILGGLIMSNYMIGLTPATFVNRIGEALTLQSYLSGVGKTPVFAAIIATVGCFQGFRVFGSAGSVGRQTTISVVQSIFLVLIVDAAFSIAFSKLGI